MALFYPSRQRVGCGLGNSGGLNTLGILSNISTCPPPPPVDLKTDENIAVKSFNNILLCRYETQSRFHKIVLSRSVILDAKMI